MAQAVSLMQAEERELGGINNSLPPNVQRLREFKAEAKELLVALP